MWGLFFIFTCIVKKVQMQKTILLWLAAINSLLAQQSNQPNKAYQMRVSKYFQSRDKALFKSKDKSIARMAAMGKGNPKVNGSSDTLYVGFSGKDTVITGTFNHRSEEHTSELQSPMY